MKKQIWQLFKLKEFFFSILKVFVRNIKTMILSKTFDFTLVKTQKLTQNYLEQ